MLAVVVVAFLAAVYLVWDADRLADAEHGRVLPPSGHRAPRVVAGVVAFVGLFVLRADAAYLYDGLTSRALPLVILSALCGAGLARPARCATTTVAPACSPSAR